MPEKKVSYFTEMARTANQALVYARIDNLVNSDATHVKAYATVNLGGSFSVHGVKVVDSQKGLFGHHLFVFFGKHRLEFLRQPASELLFDPVYVRSVAEL